MQIHIQHWKGNPSHQWSFKNTHTLSHTLSTCYTCVLGWGGPGGPWRRHTTNVSRFDGCSVFFFFCGPAGAAGICFSALTHIINKVSMGSFFKVILSYIYSIFCLTYFGLRNFIYIHININIILINKINQSPKMRYP